MADVSIEIQNLTELRANLRAAPKISLRWLNKALAASVFEIQKNAVDSNFQFKTPRSKRTGLLALSFKYGTVIKDLYASVGPTVFYAPYVYYGTSRGISPNPFMDRIAKISTPEIQKHFNDAVEGIATEIANTPKI